MQIYTHDYTLASEAEDQLYIAQSILRQDDIPTALEAIACARELLQRYLSQDNMVPDNDAEGWIRSSDITLGDGDDRNLI